MEAVAEPLSCPEHAEALECPICDSVGRWRNVDQFRLKAVGMCMCEGCGFITYPDRVLNPEALKEHYRGDDYRSAPTVSNMFSGERKLHYHSAFLQSHMAEIAKMNGGKPRVLEFGSAFGMFLKWIKAAMPGAELFGTELTLSFRRNAWHLYKIRLDEQADLTKKYDLITSYRVHEHIPRPDVELRKAVESLSDGGLFYISVPTWFNELVNFGMTSAFDIEYYYEPDHVNAWSRNLFEQLLKKVGLEVVKENHTYYGQTYLCRRNDEKMKEPRTYDDVAARLEELRKVKEAALLAMDGKYAEAIAAWPNFPDAQINAYEISRNKSHQQGFAYIKANFIDKWIQVCPNSMHICNAAADLAMRYEQYPVAMELLNRSLEMRPNDPSALTLLGHTYRGLFTRAEDPAEKLKFLKESQQVMLYLQKTSKQSEHDSITWVMQDNARLPTPHEEIKAAEPPAG